ncbi:hypothetical protein AGMMS50212_16900 [Spirochaetia bacterium]|nr:hypothetical protein AGMMS50212_16900 [Spirochaetia bacterium]
MITYMTKRKNALFGMVLCMLFWGLSFVSIKVAVQVYPPMTLGFLRFAIAVIFLFIIKRAFEKKTGVKEKLSKRDLPALIGASITGVSLYFFFENNGVARVTISEASIIIGVIPVLSMAAEAVIYRIRIKAIQWAGAFVSILGVCLVSISSIAISGSVSGYMFMGSAVICWVIYNFTTKSLSNRCSQIFIVFWQSLFG